MLLVSWRIGNGDCLRENIERRRTVRSSILLLVFCCVTFGLAEQRTAVVEAQLTGDYPDPGIEVDQSKGIPCFRRTFTRSTRGNGFSWISGATSSRATFAQERVCASCVTGPTSTLMNCTRAGSLHVPGRLSSK